MSEGLSSDTQYKATVLRDLSHICAQDAWRRLYRVVPNLCCPWSLRSAKKCSHAPSTMLQGSLSPGQSCVQV